MRIAVPDAPTVSGLSFRRFAGPADYPAMAAVSEAEKIADRSEGTTTVDDVARAYRHLVNSDPNRDVLFTEVDGVVIGYGRGWWGDEWSGTRNYWLFAKLDPRWRACGIRLAMLRWLEARMREVAAGHPSDLPKTLQAAGDEYETDWLRLLESEGYAPVRWGRLMVRSLAEPIPACPLPDGLEVRPVQESDIFAIWRAGEEAFRDHWGHGEWKDEGLAEWRESPSFQTHLWQVGWDGDRVAGAVLAHVDEAENREFGRKRAFAQSIFVRRPWRGRGLAKALITRSLLAWKQMGMTEAAHGVDTQNATGALQLYESLGYRATRTLITYRKPLASGDEPTGMPA